MNIVRHLAAAAVLISAAAGVLEGAPHPVPQADKAVNVALPRYRIVDLGALNAPAAHHEYSIAYSINNRGQVVGGSCGHAFFWQNGKMSDLGVLPQGTGSIARGINDKGQVVGQCTVNNSPRAFLWERGKMRDLGTLGGPMSSAQGINNKGEVVGYSAPALSFVNGVTREGPWQHPWRLAMLWTEQKGMTALGIFPDTFSSTANGINDKGQVSGSMVTVSPQSVLAVTWEAGKPRIVGHNLDPGGIDNEAGGINNLGRLAVQEVPQYSQYNKAAPQEQYFPACINDAGEAVGNFMIPRNPHALPVEGWEDGVLSHAFVWQHGKAYDLNTSLLNGAGWLLTDAKGINAKGQIVGAGFLSSDPKRHSYDYTTKRAFLLLPQ